MRHAPGDLATWHSGSAFPSWPPDGECDDSMSSFEMLRLKENTSVLIVARPTNHGAVVLLNDRLWWCSILSLDGVPSGSLGLSALLAQAG